MTDIYVCVQFGSIQGHQCHFSVYPQMTEDRYFLSADVSKSDSPCKLDLQQGIVGWVSSLSFILKLSVPLSPTLLAALFITCNHNNWSFLFAICRRIPDTRCLCATEQKECHSMPKLSSALSKLTLLSQQHVNGDNCSYQQGFTFFYLIERKSQ